MTPFGVTLYQDFHKFGVIITFKEAFSVNSAQQITVKCIDIQFDECIPHLMFAPVLVVWIEKVCMKKFYMVM